MYFSFRQDGKTPFVSHLKKHWKLSIRTTTGSFLSASSWKVRVASAAIETFNKTIGSRFFSRQEAESIFAALDFNSNGQIDYLEFQTLFASQVLFTDEKTLYNEFKRMDLVGSADQNGDGVIDRVEIKQQLSKYENDLTDSVICQFMGDFDTQKYGGITFSELKKTVRTYSESAMD